MLLNSFHEVSVTPISKPNKDTSTEKEYYRSIALMDIHTKMLNKIIEYQV
jgi:hypothetical protein